MKDWKAFFKKHFKQLIVVLLAIVIVVSYSLSRSSDRPSLTPFFSFSIISRRVLRMLTLACSASLPHCFASCLRRSSVKGGMPRRIISPLFSGVMPTLLSMMAFSMGRNIVLSHGLMAMVRASGVLMAAT